MSLTKSLAVLLIFFATTSYAAQEVCPDLSGSYLQLDENGSVSAYADSKNPDLIVHRNVSQTNLFSISYIAFRNSQNVATYFDKVWNATGQSIKGCGVDECQILKGSCRNGKMTISDQRFEVSRVFRHSFRGQPESASIVTRSLDKDGNLVEETKFYDFEVSPQRIDDSKIIYLRIK